MTNLSKTSIKNASTAEIEAAIARALVELTGWEICTVTVNAARFLEHGDGVTLELQAHFKNEPNPNLPF